MRITWKEGVQGRSLNVEELPVRGKKRLRISNFSDFSYTLQKLNSRYWLGPEEIMQRVRLSPGMTYDEAIRQIKGALYDFAHLLVTEDANVKSSGEFFSAEDLVNSRIWIQQHEDEVHYLQVAPPSALPIQVQGKDFTFEAEWDSFSIRMDRGVDPYEPSYTIIDSSSPAAARKLFKIVSADPDAMRGVSFGDLTRWLDSYKIKYEIHFSQWR